MPRRRTMAGSDGSNAVRIGVRRTVSAIPIHGCERCIVDPDTAAVQPAGASSRSRTWSRVVGIPGVRHAAQARSARTGAGMQVRRATRAATAPDDRRRAGTLEQSVPVTPSLTLLATSLRFSPFLRAARSSPGSVDVQELGAPVDTAGAESQSHRNSAIKNRPARRARRASAIRAHVAT